MFQAWAENKWFKGLVFAVLGLGALALAAYTYQAYRQAKYVGMGIPTISVQGTAERSVAPDVATFVFSVTSEDAEVATAQQKSADATKSIIDYLKEQGVEERDIKTVSYNVYPKYDYNYGGECDEWGRCVPGNQRLVGYTVDESVSVKVRDTAKAGDLIAGAGSRGATNVSGLSFTIDDPDGIKAEVRAEAIADAKEKAEKLAESLGVHLGKLTGYYEEMPYYPYDSYGYGGMMMEKAAYDGMAAPSIAPGESELTSTVNLVYEIR